MSEKMSKAEALSGIGKVLLKATGADIVAPAKMRKEIVECFKVEENPDFITINEAFNKIASEDDKVNILQAIFLTHLRPTQMMHFYDVISVGIEGILKHVSKFPEYRNKGGMDEILEDFNIID